MRALARRLRQRLRVHGRRRRATWRVLGPLANPSPLRTSRSILARSRLAPETSRRLSQRRGARRSEARGHPRQPEDKPCGPLPQTRPGAWPCPCARTSEPPGTLRGTITDLALMPGEFADLLGALPRSIPANSTNQFSAAFRQAAMSLRRSAAASSGRISR